MMRETEIKKAFKEWNDINNDTPFYSTIPHPDSFLAGAKWADEHPISHWHKVKDNDYPTHTDLVLVKDKWNSYVIAYYSGDSWFDTEGDTVDGVIQWRDFNTL